MSCGTSFLDNSTDKQAPEFGKGFKPENNGGCGCSGKPKPKKCTPAPPIVKTCTNPTSFTKKCAGETSIISRRLRF